MRSKSYRLVIQRSRTLNYGFFEALLFPTSIDYYLRYADVVNEVKKDPHIHTILEVGSGGEGIGKFLAQTTYNIILTDVSKNVLQERISKDVQFVVADGCRLPFTSSTFDLVASLATLEHIPRDKRKEFINEVKRVTKDEVILHFPLESRNGMFNARTQDAVFQRMCKSIFGFEDKATSEHIAMQHPMMDDILGFFPYARIHGSKNSKLWLKYMLLSRRSLGFLTGLVYYLFLKRDDNRPPYLECMIVYMKSKDTNILGIAGRNKDPESNSQKG